MKYILNNKVVYDTEKAELTVIDSQPSKIIKITNIANHILSLLVASSGEVLTRGYLFEQVWESEGLDASNSSLSQNISILRKVLTSTLDISDTIIVKPRTGFFISRNISIEVFDESLNTYVLTNHASGKIYGGWFKKSYIIFAFVTLLIFIFTSSFYQYKNSDLRFRKLYILDVIGHCEVYTYDKNSLHFKAKILSMLKIFKPNFEKLCTDHLMKVSVNVQPRVFFGDSGRVFYSFCLLNSTDHQVTFCENYYVFNWKNV
ncbi:winged helix-turn-helix domain-containing protein [Pantoea ananatis]|uniref:winged helix-turn-helix domain-containing protein n=1 Tax=Pantoea ananas TaxID=553 RepID=UPI0018909576|nr:winged helix-turn-helix domain-containing protein [Pantoea ananatis]